MTQKTISINTLSGRSRVGIIALMGLVFACCPLVILIPILADGNDPLFILLIFLPFFLVGMGIFLYALIVYASRARVGKPEMLISKDRLRLGETFNVNLMHTFKRNIQVEQINVALVFRETATYQQGTDTRTVVHNETIENYEIPGGEYRSGQLLQENYNMQIPFDGMHTLKVRRNMLQWFVRIAIGIPRLPDYIDEYELTVLPERTGESTDF